MTTSGNVFVRGAAISMLVFALSACGSSSSDSEPDPNGGNNVGNNGGDNAGNNGGDNAGNNGGDDKLTDSPLLPGKTDGARESGATGIAELGRVTGDPSATTFSGHLEGTILHAYRFNAFGTVDIRAELNAAPDTFDAFLILEGPIGFDTTPQIIDYNDDASATSFDSALELQLTEPGAYRLLVASYGSLFLGQEVQGDYTLKLACDGACSPSWISLPDLLEVMQQQIGAEGLSQLLDGSISALFPDAETAQAVKAQVAPLLANANQGADPFGDLGPFPVVPMSLIQTAQGLFEPQDVAQPDPRPVTFELRKLELESCQPDRATLEPVDPRIPGLMTGSMTDFSRADCNLFRSQQLAEVLNNLALENGSKVVTESGELTTVEEVIRALIETGHHIRVENNRYFADFLGLSFMRASVAAPVWLDTGIPSGDGTLAFPSPHTHHSIFVSGPLLDAEIMYYMGISGGVSFRAVGNIRGAWTGERAEYVYDSNDDPEAIVELMVTAGQLRKRWTEEGKDLPAQGYGQLGVCNDSTAVLEHTLEQTITTFPLVAPGVEGEPQNAIEAALNALPNDALGLETEDAKFRMRKSLPFERAEDSAFPWLWQQLGE